MQSIMSLSRVAVLLCCLFGAAGADNAVAVLTQENYTSFVESHDLVLVEFAAPWCGHCRKMGKEYENAANSLEKLKSPGRLAIIDASLKENHGIVDTAQVEGYPAFLLYRKGKHVLSYSGLRTESHFVEYMLRKNAPLIHHIKKLDDLLTYLMGVSHTDPLKKSDGVDGEAELDTSHAHYVFIGMISSKGENGASKEEMETYQKLMEDVSARNDDTHIHYLFTDNESVMDYLLISEESFHSFSIASIMLMNGDNFVPTNPLNSIVRTDITTSEQLFNFVMTSCSETMIPFQSSNLHILRNSYAPKNQVLVFCDASDTLGKACLEQVEMIAPLYRGTFLFVSVSHQELHLYHTFGIKIGTPHPQLVILNITNDQELTKFVLDADTFTAMSQQDSQNDNAEGFAQIKKDRDGTFLLTEDAIHRFLKMYLSNDLLPYYRSEENAHASVADSSVEEENSGDKDAVATSVDQEREDTEDLLPLRVTSATLKQLVMDSTETMLLFITAPWCGHCKSLEPVIRALAKLLHQRKRKYEQASAIPSLAGLPISEDILATRSETGAKDDVVVAQIDGAANDLHSLGSVDVNGFPTIVFVRYVNGEKEAVEYTGERSVKDILQYIHKNGVPLTTSTISDAETKQSLSEEL